MSAERRPYGEYCAALRIMMQAYIGSKNYPDKELRIATMKGWERMALAAVTEDEWNEWGEGTKEQVLAELNRWQAKAKAMKIGKRTDACSEYGEMSIMDEAAFRQKIGVGAKPAHQPVPTTEASRQSRQCGRSGSHGRHGDSYDQPISVASSPPSPHNSIEQPLHHHSYSDEQYHLDASEAKHYMKATGEHNGFVNLEHVAPQGEVHNRTQVSPWMWKQSGVSLPDQWRAHRKERAKDTGDYWKEEEHSMAKSSRRRCCDPGARGRRERATVLAV